MTILEILIVLALFVAVIIFMLKRKGKQTPHQHNWIFMYNYKDGLNTYSKFYCSGCLAQSVAYFNSRKGAMEITKYDSEEVKIQ
jgi:hypothetical protein